MDVAAVLASMVVGAVFVVSGSAKLANRPRWSTDARAMSVPAPVIEIVPWFELVLGALLVVQVARRPLSVVAVFTLIVFTVVLLSILRSGRRPTCACFGSWSDRPLGVGHVVRNAALIAVGLVAIV